MFNLVKGRVSYHKTLRLCVKAVTEPDSAESTEITERSGPNLRKTADNYDIPIPVFSSVTGSI